MQLLSEALLISISVLIDNTPIDGASRPNSEIMHLHFCYFALKSIAKC